ncbi:hypothetical protein GCM10027034_26460 [Ramlibacter solisilvae]
MLEALQVFVAGAAGADRMDAQRVAVAMPVRQVPHGREVAHLNRGQHAVRDPGLQCALTDAVPVAREFGRVQVAMCINP